MEHSSCGVGFLARLDQLRSHDTILDGLTCLNSLNHRGGDFPHSHLGDGAGIMTDIPYELFNKKQNTFAVGTLFIPVDPKKRKATLKIFEDTFAHFELKIESYRDVPMNPKILDIRAKKNKPIIKHVFIERPAHCRTLDSFEKLLYFAKQITRAKEGEAGIPNEFFFTSLSCRTIVYKALCTSSQLGPLYPDLLNPKYKSRFALFHRRYSTNSLSTWDKTQPFRLIGHNGEINTIAGNRSNAFIREFSLGLRKDELLAYEGTSDSGNFNGMVEALKHRSSIPNMSEILSIMIPPSKDEHPYYKFWSRAMEPWDGPALITYSDGKTVGARLDRNGFRPARWSRNEKYFLLSSEAGVLPKMENPIAKGALWAGRNVTVFLDSGEVSFLDSPEIKINKDAIFDPRLQSLDYIEPPVNFSNSFEKASLYGLDVEDFKSMLDPMILDSKEPIGSMGDTAQSAILSNRDRPLFDYFFQNFAQVTNPALDYIREKNVTDMSVQLGRAPNIFNSKDLIPPRKALEIKGPIISLGQMEFLKELTGEKGKELGIDSIVIDCTFEKGKGIEGLKNRLDEIKKETLKALLNDITIIILSDKKSDNDFLPIPSLIYLRTAFLALKAKGTLLKTSLVVETGEVTDPHRAATLISFGASAVCPYLALEYACFNQNPQFAQFNKIDRERRLLRALHQGVLRIMSKVGISVLKSYQSSELHTILGPGPMFNKEFFPDHTSVLGGFELEDLANVLLKREVKDLGPSFKNKEHPLENIGELHSVSTKWAKEVQNQIGSDKPIFLGELEKVRREKGPVHLRDLLDIKRPKKKSSKFKIQTEKEILKKFGTGGMSFGALGEGSHADLIKAMSMIGARSNSGEGGENPQFFTTGLTSYTKQIASARFGVSAQFLVTGKEVQIKISQGAKPGEGGQLMGIKVNEKIALTRFATAGVDLISPSTQHDIYSIEDLKELIYEIKQLDKNLKVNVKLVSGKNIGTIATGVVKAGADIIHISGADGGTGAASIISMKHAGLPLELGIVEVHRHLIKSGLRKNIILRVDGGLKTGLDVIKLAILGGEEFDFGKMALIAEGCIMARVCQKNTCPTGIATQDPKFEARYKGTPEKIVKLYQLIAKEVQSYLKDLNIHSLKDLVGRYDLLVENKKWSFLIKNKKINLSYFFGEKMHQGYEQPSMDTKITNLNLKIIKEFHKQIEQKSYSSPIIKINSQERAALSTLCGKIAKHEYLLKFKQKSSFLKKSIPLNFMAEFNFSGSAGQGFGVFLTKGVKATLVGEANDFVGKSMSGGELFIRPSIDSRFAPEKNYIIGNCALYGATGGELYAYGVAGDRFAVRNSGAITVVEGVGLHACEYMTSGTVVILGQTQENVGTGMTGGEIYLHENNLSNIHRNYIKESEITDEDKIKLIKILSKYYSFIEKKWDQQLAPLKLVKVIPKN